MQIHLLSSVLSTATYSGTVKKLRFRVDINGRTVYVSFNGESEVILQQNTYFEPDKPVLGFCLFADRFKLPPIVRYPIDTDIYCNFADSDTLSLWLIQDTSTIPTDLTLELYKNKSELNSINKDIELVSSLTGYLREACGIISPSIVVEISTLPEFNYVYIPNFHRYYFVGNVVSVSKTLWRIDLRVDVLMSYRLSIYKQTGLIGRQEFDYNIDLVDNERLVETEFTVNKYDMGDTIFSLLETANNRSGPFNFIVSVAQWAQDPVDETIPSTYQLEEDLDKSSEYPRSRNFGAFSMNRFETFYLFSDFVEPRTFLDKLVQNNFTVNSLFNNPSEFILSIRVYPFSLLKFSDRELENWYPEPSGATPNHYSVSVGSTFLTKETDSGTWTLSAYRYGMPKQRSFTYTINRYFNDFMDFAPYTKLTLSLPFGEFMELPTNEVMGKEIKVSYMVDIHTGNLVVTVHVKVSTNNYRLIGTTSYPIAYNIPIGRTNATERGLNDAIRKINFKTGLYTAGISAVGGTLSGIFGGKFGISKGIQMGTSGVNSLISSIAKNKINEITNNQETYSGGSGSGGLSESTLSYRCNLIVKRPIPIPIDENYNHLKGRPLGEYRTLGVLRGFTIVDDIHLKEFDSATDSEVNQIEQLLRTGVQL